MAALFRARSTRLVPIKTAAMTVMWLYYRVPQPVWRAATYFTRVVLSSGWAEDLCDTNRAHILPGVPGQR